MKEIEFRAWDKKEKIMLNIGLVNFKQKVIYGATSDDGTFCKSYVEDSTSYGEGWGNIEDVILEQFTGLFDRNGVKIFEEVTI